MKELYTSTDSSRIGLCQSVLESAGIASFVQNESSPWLGNMMSPAVHPTLCIFDDERYDEAVALLKPMNDNETVTRADWMCAKCGESNPSSFEVCWSCDFQVIPNEAASAGVLKYPVVLL